MNFYFYYPHYSTNLKDIFLDLQLYDCLMVIVYLFLDSLYIVDIYIYIFGFLFYVRNVSVCEYKNLYGIFIN